MKRLTKKVDGAWTAICEYGNPPYFVVTQDVIDRLAAIEDILGDEYELDAVAWVVRCKNCRYYRDAKINEKGFLICPASGMEITENDFCSYGESPKVAMKARELDEQYLL